MQITYEFIHLISFDETLNKEQCKILNLPFPLEENWKEKILQKDILKNDANRLMLLKGKLAVKAQEQILKNYNMIIEFNSSNKQVQNDTKKTEISARNTVSNASTNDDEEHIRINCDYIF